MKTIRRLILPPGHSIISDVEAVSEALATIGVPKFVPDKANPGGSLSRHTFYRHHPSHWLLISAYAGNADPSRNGHEIICLDRDMTPKRYAKSMFKLVEFVGKNGVRPRTSFISASCLS